MTKVRTIEASTAKLLAGNAAVVAALPELKAVKAIKKCCGGRTTERVDVIRVKRILSSCSLTALAVVKSALKADKIRIDMPSRRGTKAIFR